MAEASMTMTTCVSMLRGINVGGKNKVGMEALKKLHESLGLGNVRTYVQSGNVVFECAAKEVTKMAERIGRKMKVALGLDITVILRTRAELQKVVDGNPFTDRDPDKLHVTFLAAVPGNVPREKIIGVKDELEGFSVSGRDIYLYCPNGYGRTKLSNNFFERVLETPATTRNWRTVNRLLVMMNGQ